MNTYALDYETYYDKSCSIKTLGPLGYFAHPDFDAYMVSVVGDEGTSFVGHPKDFNWATLEGQQVLSHNASFDQTLYLFGVKKGWWPNVDYALWHCTADLAAYCGLPRSLKGATGELFDLEISKDTRDNMKGKRWEDMSQEFKVEVSAYALKDSELCLRLWQGLSDQWPPQEREISGIGRRGIQRGIPIDTHLLKEQRESISKKRFEAENSIPWIEDSPPLSRKAFNEECRKIDIEPPASLALSSEEANEWVCLHGKDYPWIEAVRDYRRINALKRKLDSFDHATLSNGRFYGGLMYFGAHTGRWSGSGGNLNLQNLPRGDLFGVNLRHLISPGKGKKLIVADLSQIEVRTLCWLAEDGETLAEIEKSDDIYEAFAVRFGKWSSDSGVLKDENPKLRHMIKQMVLGCGYGASANKFSMISGMPLREAHGAVMLYRNKLNRVVRLWNNLQRKMHIAYAKGEDFILRLPSGRELNYGKITTALQEGRRNYIAMITRNSRKIPMRLWGGLLAENLSQALARDIFADMLLRIEATGARIIFHVHDEFIIETDEGSAEKTLTDVIESMSQAPNWIPDIPLAAEGKILDRYEK
jgi:DNA polymerase I-like protein with 3'-5' exonuclease and polymerase domains|tara:strand:+ start:1921 stop:3681 length:1761 start_codon:yes stop_codon:yes gene_type:complete